MADKQDKGQNERQIVLRAGRGRGLDTKLRGKSECPGCGETIFGKQKTCRYCDYDLTAKPAPIKEQKPAQKRLGESRVDKRAKDTDDTGKKKWGLFAKNEENPPKGPPQSSGQQPEKVLPKHLQHMENSAKAPPKKKEPEYDPNMVDGMEISFAGEKQKSEQDPFDIDLTAPPVKSMPAPISIPWERLLGYLLIAVAGFAANYFVADEADTQQTNPEYQKAVQSLCREYCSHEKMTRVETGQLHREDTEFLANCMYHCFKSGGDTARGDAAHHGSRLDKK